MGSTPTFDWAKPKPQGDSGAPTFDWAKTEQPQRQGFFDYLGDLTKNFMKVVGVDTQLGPDPTKDPSFPNPEMQHIRDAIRKGQANGSGLPQTVHDFVHLFGKMFEDAGAQIGSLKDLPAQIAEHPFDTAGNLLKGFVTPIGDLAELASGVHLTQDDITALTPEDKAARIKNAIATGVMLATGTAASKLLATRAGIGVAQAGTLEDALAASRLTAKGALARNLMRSAAVGGASGAAYGLVAHSNEPDQLAEIITNGIVFAPLGVAHELLRTPRLIREQKTVAKAAGELAQLKATQVGPSDSFESATAKVEAVSEANHIDEAALLGKIGKQSIAIVPGVDPAHISSLVEKAKGYRASIFSRHDGTADILMHDGLLPKEQEAFFKRYGVYKGQRVSYNGQELSVSGVEGDKLMLRGTDFKMVADPKEVRLLSKEYPVVEPEGAAKPLEVEPDERALINKSVEDIAQQKADLIDKALSNNMRVRTTNGKIEIRDMESDRVLGSFDNHEDAAKFIDGSGQSDAIDLDKDSKGVDTGSAAGGRGLPPSTPVPPAQRAYPWRPFEKKGGVGAIELVLRSMDNVAFITRNQDFFLKLDSDHQTELHAKVIDPTQKMISVRNAAMKPWIEKLQPLLKPIAKMSQVERVRISEYLKTMSPGEVRAKFHVSSMEDAIATEAAAADLPRVFSYLDQLDRIEEEFKQNPQSPQDVLANGDKKTRYIVEAEKRLGLSPDDKAVAEKLKSARELNNPSVRVGIISRLANSISSGELSRGQYAAKFKMTGQQFTSAHHLQTLERELNDRFGLPQGISASDYIDHANAYFDSNLERAMKDFPGSPDFFNKIGRAGFTPQVDPVHHILEYIRRGFDVRSGMQDTMDGMRKAVTEELKKLPDAKQKHVGHVINNYLDDLKGYPDANDTFLQSSVDTFLDKAGLQGVSADVRKNFVNTFLAFTHLGGVGFRGIYGLFHFHTGVSVSIAGRSLAYTGRMLAAGAHALRNPELIDEIRQEGGLSTISPIMQLSPTEYALESSTAQRAIVQGARKASELGLKLTLMPTVFEGLSAGHFLTTKADALAALAQYGRQDLSVPGGLSWEQVRKKLFLGRYDQAVEDQFKRFVDAGKPEDAASYLGRRAVNDMVGQFGNANRPYKWGTVWGRLIGQFGVWPAWLRSEVARLASRGTPGERVAAIAKLSAVYWASAAAGNELGLDVHRLNPFHSLFIGTGPFLSMLLDIHTATTGTGYSQQAAKSRLQRMLPLHTDRNGNTKFSPSLLVPGSFELDSFLQGLKDVSDDPMLGAWEMAGGRPSPDVQTMRQRYGLQQ